MKDYEGRKRRRKENLKPRGDPAGPHLWGFAS